MVVDALDECKTFDGCRSGIVKEILNLRCKVGNTEEALPYDIFDSV